MFFFAKWEKNKSLTFLQSMNTGESPNCLPGVYMEPQEASTYLLPLFVIHMWCYHHGSQRATGDVSWWQDIFILFSSTGSGLCPRFTGAELDLWEFSHHCKSHYKSLQWWENSHRYSSAPVNLGQNPDPVPEKSINISCHQLTSSVALWLPWW